MYNNTCTNWQDVKEWIEDNKLQRYTFRSEKQAEGTRANCVVFAYDSQDTPEENLRLCEKRLQAASGQHLYGTGFRTTANTGGLCVEVQYTGMQQQQVFGCGTGMVGASIDEEAITARIRKELKQEMELEELRRREKEIEAREKEYEAQKSSVLGGIFTYLAPYLPQLLGANSMANVAGAGGPVQAERIIPADPAPAAEAEEEDPNDLPDEEAAKIYELIKRFRSVEPEYLQLIESVVEMAEKKDPMYGVAKNFLVKKG